MLSIPLWEAVAHSASALGQGAPFSTEEFWEGILVFADQCIRVVSDSKSSATFVHLLERESSRQIQHAASSSEAASEKRGQSRGKSVNLASRAPLTNPGNRQVSAGAMISVAGCCVFCCCEQRDMRREYLLLCNGPDGCYSVYRMREGQQLQKLQTALSPGCKIAPSILKIADHLYVGSTASCNKWEISSPLWRFNLTEQAWQELVVRDQTAQKDGLPRIQPHSILALRHCKPDQLAVYVVQQKGVLEWDISSCLWVTPTLATVYQEVSTEFFTLKKVVDFPFSLQLMPVSKFPEVSQLWGDSAWHSTKRPLYLCGFQKERSANSKSLIQIDFSEKSVKSLDLGIWLPSIGSPTLTLEGEVPPQQLLTIYNQMHVGLQDPLISQAVIERDSTLILRSAVLLHCQERPKTCKNVNLSYFYLEASLDLRNLLESGKKTELSDFFNRTEYSDLIFIAEKKQVYCSRRIFELHSPKFKKLYSASANSGKTCSLPTIVKLDHSKLATVYFLVQQLYHHFTLPLDVLDQATLLDLMVLAQKFQIRPLQAHCEASIVITMENFSRLYDYHRNCQSARFREDLLKFFVIHSQEVMKNMPIGKVEELIRLVYSPECQHSHWTEFRANVEGKCTLRDSAGLQEVFEATESIPGLIKDREVCVQVCQRCQRLLGAFEQHRKNRVHRSSSRGHHRKKENNSN